MKKKIYLLILLGYLISTTSAQTIPFNNDWQFQRIDANTKEIVLKNQGTDWESQFNVTHTNVKAALTVPIDTLNAEAGIASFLLQTGNTRNLKLKVISSIVRAQKQYKLTN